jgi:hypothetical protein
MTVLALLCVFTVSALRRPLTKPHQLMIISDPSYVNVTSIIYDVVQMTR